MVCNIPINRSFGLMSKKVVQVVLLAVFWQALLSPQQCNQVIGFKIFGFDLSRLASLRLPQARPAYQPNPTYQQIPEPPPPHVEQQPNLEQYQYHQPEYNSIYSDQFSSHPQTKHDIYNPAEDSQQYLENQAVDNHYDNGYPHYASYDYQNNNDELNRQHVQDESPSPVYIPPQYSEPVYTTTTSSPINQFNRINSYINNKNQEPISYSHDQADYDYQELEIITAPTVKSKASVYGGQHTFDVKVGAGFHTSTR